MVLGTEGTSSLAVTHHTQVQTHGTATPECPQRLEGTPHESAPAQREQPEGRADGRGLAINQPLQAEGQTPILPSLPSSCWEASCFAL